MKGGFIIINIDKIERRIQELPKLDFGEQQKHLPEGFVNNYFFQRKMTHLYELYKRIMRIEYLNEDLEKELDCVNKFSIKPSEDEITLIANFLMQIKQHGYIDKNQITVSFNGLNKIFKFHQREATINKRKYVAENDDFIDDLTIKEADDLNKIFVMYRITGNMKDYRVEWFLRSIFDIRGNELVRLIIAKNLTNKIIIYSEDYRFIRGLANTFVAKYESNKKNRYAIFQKPMQHKNKAYQRSYDCVRAFDGGNYNLDFALDSQKKVYLHEIDKDIYDSLTHDMMPTEDIKKILKKSL